jgi:hypothetical protein
LVTARNPQDQGNFKMWVSDTIGLALRRVGRRSG